MNIVDTFVIPRGEDGERGADLMERTGAALRSRAVDALQLHDAARVLEIGFGPGLALRALLSRVPDGHVTGIDPSALMHRRARARNTDALRRGQLDLVVGYANTLPFAPESFNAVLAIDNAHFWNDLPSALSGIRRILDGATGSLVLALSPESGGSSRALLKALERAAFSIDHHDQSPDGFLVRASVA